MKATVHAALRRAVKVVARGADAVRRRPPGVVVLAYHRVGAGSDSEVDLPLDTFRRQMEWLAGTGLVVSLDEALTDLVADEPPPQDRIVVTFDDGTPDLVDNALPVLAELRIPATLYVATGHVESGSSFWDDGTVMTWGALAELRDSGWWSLASHGHDHRLFDRISAQEAAGDLERSIALLGERLGVEAVDFAYPKALAPTSAAVASVVTDRTRSAALAGTRANPYRRTDVHRLARSPIQASDGIRWFTAKARGGMELEADLRSVLDRRRYAQAAS
jgi:peptidoglycan/xylan/chitin deacetylase (PgdA/CDA1 family)